MKWIQQGRIFEGCRKIPWMKSHAMIPTADHVQGNVFRVYFSPRDEQNRSNTAWIEIDITDPTNILGISQDPVLACGELGSFDDSGTLASWVVNYQDKKYLYYFGYNIGVTVLCRNFIGLAVSEDGGQTFRKFSRAPIMDRSEIDPFFAVTPCVLREENLWKMWYASGSKWSEQSHEKPRPNYHIKYAESLDGVHWNPTGIVCIDYKSEAEYAIARPTVFRDGDLYRMWFCCRGQRYRIGYAESRDGKQWDRKDDEAGITLSESGWDNETIAYPFVFTHQSETYMLYNGNEYGKSGFGLAKLEM